MKINQSIKTILTLAAFAAIAAPRADAAFAVVGIDFNVGSGATHSGDPDKTAPLHLSTQTNAWNELALGGTNPTVTTTEGPTLTITGVFNTNYEAFDQAGSALREDIMASDPSPQRGRYTGAIPFTLTGLTPNAIYDLSFLRGGNSLYNVAITGASSPTVDADGDGNFTGVLSGSGSISGTFESPSGWRSVAGIQFEQTGVVPEPTTTALLGLGGLALILRRRK
jgi:hypothetical protein